jgi:hypothetical protein
MWRAATGVGMPREIISSAATAFHRYDDPPVAQ